MKKHTVILGLYLGSLLYSPLSSAKASLYISSELKSDSAVHGSLELIHCLFIQGDILVHMQEEQETKKLKEKFPSYPILHLKEISTNTIEASLYGIKGKEDLLLRESFLSNELQEKLCASSIQALNKGNTNINGKLLKTVELKEKNSLLRKKEFWIAATLLGFIGLGLIKKEKQEHYMVRGAKINR